MGVIQRQSLKHTAVNMAGLGVGALSTLYVYPNVLEGHGLFQLLLGIGIIGLPVMTLGANTLGVRFFPRFMDKTTGHHGFLGLLLLQCLTGIMLCSVVAWLSWPWLGPFLKANNPILAQYLWAAIPLSGMLVTSMILSVYSANFKRIVVPSLLLDFSQKLIIPLLLVGVWQGWWSLDIAVTGMLVHAVVVLVSMALYINHLGHWYWRWPDTRWITPQLRRDMIQFVGFGAFGGFALLMASKADIFVVGTLRPLKDASVYALSAFFAATMDIPAKSLYSASISSVASYLEHDDRAQLGSLYKKVSIHLLAAGVFLFGAIWVSIDALYSLMDNSEVVSAGKWVFFFIGLSKLIESVTGLNNYLVYYSKYYIWSIGSLGLMAIVNVACGAWLVPQVGIAGAAIATLISMTAYNLFSLALVWRKFRLQPFQRTTLYLPLLGLLAYACVAWLPTGGWPPLVQITVRSGGYTLILAGLYWRVGISDDFEALMRRVSAFLR
jgi:O-antigen/teichoic acid export membrane protein